ncbi:MAG: choice-of-anchor Q domain-containing protein [Solirubrobacteraceae bacterium]
MALVAAVGLLAFLPATAAANGPITVNEQTTDAGLEPAGDSKAECISEGAEKGCSLRAAVELANYESREFSETVTIDVPAGTFGNTPEYGTFEIEVGAHIVIVGAGADETKIEGAGEEPHRASIFTVDEGASLTLQKVTLLHGYAESGRGNGGAIDGEGGASVTIEQSAIEHSAADHDGGGVYGGDDSFLHEGALITIKHSTITENFAEGSDEGGGNGGGVDGEPGASITIAEESTIAKNTADRNGGGVSAGTGILVTNTECDVLGATSSTAHARSDVESDSSVSAGLTIKQSKIEGNTAEGDGRGEGGGGVYVSQGEEEECVREEFRAHSSTQSPKPATVASDEGEIAIEQSKIEGNDATQGDGGGVDAINYGGCGQSATSLTVEQSTIANNTAKGEGGDGDGGGIYAANDVSGCSDTRSAHSSGKHAKPAAVALSDEFGLMIEQSTLAENRAGADGGGDGGGIYEDLENNDPIINSTIADNAAGDDGGGMYAAEEDLGFLVSDTVSDNESEGGNAGNLATEEFGAIDLLNTIVAEKGDQKNCEGEIFGEGYNLDYPSESGSPDSCGLSESDHDLVGVEPGFEGGLQNHGGPTQTIALASSSPAIGVVPLAGDCEEPSPEGPSSVDQRGEPRPGIAGDGCDIGAYEYQSNQPEPQPEFRVSLSPLTAEQEAGTTQTHAVTATVTQESVPAARARAALAAAKPGVDVTFTVTGQNGGVTGTCTTPEGASDPACATNSEGKVVFTYADAKGAGTDTIDASVVVGATTDRATASMKWTPVKEQVKPGTTTTATPVASTSVLPFKIVSRCTSKRDITIHIQNVKQLGVVSAVISINGHSKRTLRGRHLTAAINLVGLPKGTFTIEIVARTSSGHTLRGKRVYHTCRGTPLPGHSYLPL